MKKTKIQKVDMISELPEPILHHILSFLDFRQAAQTCVLSKNWERVWLTYPVVDIYNGVFNFPFHCKRALFRRRRLRLLDSLEKSLRNRHHHFKDLDFNVPKELRETLPSPLFSGKHFKLLIKETSLPFSIAKVVDDMLSIAPHTKTVSIEYGYFGGWSETSFEFSYKMPLAYEGEDSSCFKSHPISCWQHCIEEVKLEIRNSERIDIKGCSLDGAEFLEKIDGLCTLRSMMKSA